MRRSVPLLLVALLLLSGCAPGRRAPAALENRADWRELSVDRPLPARAWLRGRADVLWIYVEGDGNAYSMRTRPSLDPTPHAPAALILALKDDSPAVAYAGRPCQYGPDEPCVAADWTTGRFSERVLAAENGLVDRLKTAAGARKVVLVGFSGGGAVAALLAARRSDVAGLVTVCGVLDHELWTRLHGVTPLSGSLNPADAAPRLGGVPQVHFSGGEDRIAPPELAASFARRLPPGAPCTLITVPGLAHDPHGCPPIRGFSERLNDERLPAFP